MAPQTAKSLMKDFRQSFRRKKSSEPRIDKAKETEAEERAKLAELKENYGENVPSNYTDADLLGYLRARSLNVREAEKLLRLDINLKKFLLIDDLVKNHQLSEVNTKFSVSGVLGFDKEGSLVRVINMGRGDSKGIFHSVSTIENFRFFLMFIERDRILQEKENKRTGRNRNQFLYIIDMADISMNKVMYKPALDTGLLSLKLLQDHYHDLPKSIIIINAPTYYSALFKLFKPVIQDSLNKKIRILASSDNWQDELLRLIDSDVLPEYLGGNRVDCNGDPFCKEFIGFGGVVPESFHSTAFLDPDDPEVTTLSVPAGSFANFRLAVTRPDTTVRWHIHAKENDIGVGVFLEPPESSSGVSKKKGEEDMSRMEQITPVIRSQCHVCPEVGHAVSWDTGTVVIHFDNSYSWMNAKEVMFKFSVEPPEPNALDNKTNATKK